MKHKDMIQDLKTLKEFFEEQSGAYPISLEYAIEELSKHRWIPVSERLPEADGYYLVTNSRWGSPWREITMWMTDGWQSNNKPVAWMPLPEPYEGGEKE